MMSPIDSSFSFRSPDDKALLKAAIASTDDTEAGKRKAVTFQKTYLRGFSTLTRTSNGRPFRHKSPFTFA